ncbi:hypothetical protein J6590_007591 [Homalodisca vitripennis]|nr:hypothetical protein J6590_007591 [Homalodisca vitripennis]
MRAVCITTIPQRYDAHKNNPIHDDIALVNNYIREITIRMKNVHLIYLDVLRRCHFTTHGLHSNYRGKKTLSYMIIDALENINESTCHLESADTTTQPISKPADHLPNYTSVQSQTANSSEGNIQIIEDNFKNVIPQFLYNEQVAFAHCISADLDSKKNMSAGVATIFKEQFGKPLCCLSHHLSRQKLQNGATIYGLITKPKYYNKPTIEDYSLAFQHLTEDFIRRGLKYLIYPPMGCTRDKISPSVFAANIIKFQQLTGASIRIITYNEHSKQELRNGLPYLDFVKTLNNFIPHNLQSKIPAGIVDQPANFSSMMEFPPLFSSKEMPTSYNQSVKSSFSESVNVSEVVNQSQSEVVNNFLFQTPPQRNHV